jgi:hypothetical protein
VIAMRCVFRVESLMLPIVAPNYDPELFAFRC